MWQIYLLSNKMSLLAMILWCFMSGGVLECPNPPLDYGMVSTNKITHTGYSPDNERQLMVQKAYELWWLDFVLMIECESWFNPKARWDSWRAFGLCQINNRRHKIPNEYLNNWEYQIDYCYQKWSTWTKFYWPNRRINGQICKNYVKSRFIING